MGIGGRPPGPQVAATAAAGGPAGCDRHCRERFGGSEGSPTARSPLGSCDEDAPCLSRTAAGRAATASVSRPWACSWAGRLLLDPAKAGARFDLLRRMEMSCAAARTPRHVLAGQAQEEFRPALPGCGCGSLREDPEKLAAECDPSLPDGVREQPVVPDADEALGKDVEQEAAQKRLRRQRHDLAPVAVCAVLEGENHVV